MTSAYPLQWPDGWPRTSDGDRRRAARFKVDANKCRRDLMMELRLLGTEGIVVSANAPVRVDGTPYADAARRIIRDPGVAVYFALNGEPTVMARDTFWKIEDNLRTIGLTIEAMRAIERHGGAAMMKRAFAGFAVLPAPKAWWEVLGVKPLSPTGHRRSSATITWLLP